MFSRKINENAAEQCNYLTLSVSVYSTALLVDRPNGVVSSAFENFLKVCVCVSVCV